jgi:predicted O-methyltransferase YrrM
VIVVVGAPVGSRGVRLPGGRRACGFGGGRSARRGERGAGGEERGARDEPGEGPAQASLMQILLRAAGARTVVEVGTLAGYSAIAMARALPPDGHVHTIELEPAHADFAERWVARSDVAGRVTVHRGPGAEVLPRLPLLPGAADAIFLDADKGGYPVYLEHGLRLVRPGGLILVDNAFAFGQLFDVAPTDREVGAVRAFNETMAAEARVQSVIVPIGDGLWVGVRLPD